MVQKQAKKAQLDLFRYMLKAVGPSGSRKVMGFMFAWAAVEEDLGREPSIEEYAAWWKESAATAYREKSLFRKCFPGESSPSRLNALGAQRVGRTKTKKLGDVYLIASLRESDLQ